MNKHPERGMKLAALAAALIGLLAAFVFLPMLASALLEEFPAYQKWYWPCLIYGWAVLAPGFVGLWEFWKICVEIGRDNTFSEVNARGLVRISRLMGTACALMAVGLAVLLFGRGQPEPVLEGLTALGALIALVLALFASAMAQLIRAGAALKDENDLTI